ncbi:ABC transporter permease subunit [Glaciimonas sp. PCH181]|uniref:ABC transporter permease subunit n=1 Tax=Glaciimonas sp. PCH181 TaxID=2133943 RepID=UPI000D362E0A|nr:ABC transporter permease subunit [Glaciimonas sp. PCH181]PUA19092.1 ABC transporter permease [Glaciimonas sp. PCH181]
MSGKHNSRRSWAGLALLSPGMLFLAATVFIPVTLLLLASLNSPAGFSYNAFSRLVHTPIYAQVLGHSVFLAAIAASVSVIAAFPVAVAITRASSGWQQLLWMGVLLTFWTSFLVKTIAWIVILGRSGLLNSTLISLGITNEPFELLYTSFSVIVGLVHVLLPLAVLTMLPVLQSMDKRLVPASATLGARPAVSFFVVYLPLCAPGVTAAWLSTFVSALGFFITPALLGSPRQTMIAQLIIQQVQEMMDWGLAAALSVVTLIVTLVIYWIYDRLVGLSSLAGEQMRSNNTNPSELGAWIRALKHGTYWKLGQWTNRLFALIPIRRNTGQDVRSGVRILSIIVLAVMILPVVLLIPESFTTSAFIDWPPRGFTLHWYQDLYNSPVWTGAFVRSLWVGTLAAVLASVIGIPAAFAFAQHRVPFRSLMLGLLLAPLILPRIIVALGLFYVLSRLGLVGSSIALAIGHAALALPYVVITVTATLKSYDRRLDAAASILGARTSTRLRMVTLPIIMPGVVSAFIFAFVTSFDDLTLSLFVSGGLFTTLPKQMWDDALLKVSPSLAAVSVLLFAGVLFLMAATYLVRNRLAKRRFA